MKHRVSEMVYVDQDQEPQLEKELDTGFVTIFMLPYTDWWQMMQCFGICLTSFYATFYITFCFYEQFYSLVIIVYYGVEILFFVDVVLLIINRNIVVLKKKMYQKQQHVLVIFLCFLSILPVSEVYELREMLMWNREPEVVRQFKVYLTAKAFLRFVKVILYYCKKRSEAGINQQVVIFLGQIFFVILISNVFGALWFLTNKDDPFNSWTSEVKNYQPRIGNTNHGKENNIIAKFLIAYTTMANIFAHNWAGYLKSKSVYSNLLVLLAMLFGHIYHTMIIIGLITVTFMNKQRKQMDFSTRIKIITKFMDMVRHKNPLIPKTKDYYNELWAKRAGVKSMPECFNLLPVSLQKEVTVDIFWDMFQHSHLYARVDMAIKREVSLIIKTEFLLPGDYLYRTDKKKMKMVYIVSGVIQVLSDDDDDSPLLSLSSGSLLGEFCSLFCVISNSNLRTATYCELHVLYLTDLYRVLLNYRSRTKILHNSMVRRLEKAKQFEQIRKDQTATQETNIFGHTLNTSMRRLKKQWYKIYNLENERTRSIGRVSSTNQVIDAKGNILSQHCISSENLLTTKTENVLICSQYLDLIVLSNEIELKVQAIFLKGNFPFVLDPESEFRYFIEYLCLTAVITQYFVLPYYVFFGEKLPNIVQYLLLILDAIYFFDVMVQASTAIKHKNHLITDSLVILIGRFKQLSFIIDIIATIPYDAIFLEVADSYDTAMYLKLPRLLKVYKLIFLIKQKERMLEHHIIYMRLLKYVIICICVVYFISCLNIITYPEKFFTAEGIPVGLMSAYYTLSVYTSVGIPPRRCFNTYNLIILYIVTMLAYFMYGLCFAELTSHEILLDRIDKLHKTFVTALNKYMDMRVFPIDISTRLLSIINFQWTYSNDSEFLGENSIIDDVPVNIKKNIIAKRVKDNITNMYILRYFNQDIIKYVMQIARFFAFDPEAVVVQCDSRSAYMYIILKGYCNIESSVPGDKERGLKTSIKKEGDCFPIVEVLHDVNTLIKVTALTAVEVIMIPAQNFRQLMRCYKEEFEDMTKALQIHKQVYGSILHKLEHKVPMLNKIPYRSLGPGAYFQYTYDELKSVKDEWKTFLKPYQQLGIFSMIRYFALPRTINPHGTFFKAWEATRCVFAITQFILCLLYMNVLFYHIDKIGIVFTVLNFTSYADLYVRCHCQYYNRNGILVTHPLATATHYFKHGFMLDFIGVLPFDYVYLQNMFNDSSKQNVKALLYLITRPFQLHRVFRFMLHLMKNSRISEDYAYYIKSALMVAVVLLILSSITQLVFCWGSTAEKLVCRGMGWAGFRMGLYQFNHHASILTSLYLIESVFTGGCSGNFQSTTYTDTVYLMIIIPLLTILRWVTSAKLTSKLIESENTLTKSQSNIKSYLHFVNAESVSGNIVDDLVDHYEHEVKKDHNTRLASISHRYSPQLHADIAFYDYGRALVESAILKDVDISIIKYLCTMFSRHFVKKDSEIIRCNDVNDRLYFIWRGKVDIRIANCTVATMGNGGMFGCLAKRGHMRQTISVTSTIHVELISIKSDLFHELTERYPVIKSRLDNWLTTNVEYMTAYGVSAAIIKMKPNRTDKNKRNPNIRRSWYKWTNDIINQQSRWYKIFDYILNVHLAPLSCFVVIAMQAMPTYLIFEANFAFLVTSLFFSIKLFLGFYLTYVDPESGITVTNRIKIWKRYLEKGFFIDFVSILPFQLCATYVDNTSQYSKLLYSNYLLRFVFLIRYYHVRKNRLNIENHLRWTFYIYVTIFSIQLMTFLWMLLACNRYGACTYIFEHNFHQDNGTMYSTLLVYTYVLNVFTNTGLSHARPINMSQVGMAAIIFILTYLLATILSAGFATSFMVTSYAMSNFDLEIESIKTYLINQNLSPPILEKVWIYYLQMWQREFGHWTPSVIRDAPQYLQQNLFKELYGHHLANHVLFKNTHVDFLRQLVVHFKRCVYLPGYSIVEAGDVDNTIYFIHSGEVEIIKVGAAFDIFETVTPEANQAKILIKEGGSFGEEQGLFNTPHNYTYRAYSVTDIIMLNYKHWRHLIPWFPASHEEIINRARNFYYLNIPANVADIKGPPQLPQA